MKGIILAGGTWTAIFIEKNPSRGTWYDKYMIDVNEWMNGRIKYVY